jgi:pimeloyl-ACP methyl ester carboxylesterase
VTGATHPNTVTLPALEGVQYSDTLVQGVRLERLRPEHAPERPTVVLVHGNLFGSWCWEHFLPEAARRGHDAIALNWYQHNGSDSLPTEQFLRRSVGDVAVEISIAVDEAGETPVLIGHSMGALACLAYAAAHPLRALVLLVPPMPAAAAAPPAELPVDPASPWGPPPFEMAQALFLSGLDEDRARAYYAQMDAESPQAMLEAANSSLQIDLEAVDCPILLIAADQDALTSVEHERKLAAALGAEFIVLPGRGHNVVLEPDAPETARRAFDWIAEKAQSR